MEIDVSNKRDNEMTLKVDGQEIEIGSFVQNIVSKGVVGMLETLNGVDQPKKIEITIKTK